LFLAVVIDLFSRQVVGWSLREDMTSNIVIDALRMAWFKRHPDKHAGLLFHSDRGQPVRQPRLQGCAQGVRHHELHESAWQLLG
jgi:transposase InsO family protein